MVARTDDLQIPAVGRSAPDGALVAAIYPVDQSPAAVYLARLARGSRKSQRLALERIAQELSAGRCSAESLPWGLLRYQHTAALRAQLATAYAPATANRIMSALRGVLEEAWRLGYMSAEDLHRARDVKTIRSSPLPKGRRVTSGEFVALAAACRRDESAHGPRDAGLLALLYVGGLRRAEVAALDIDDWSPATGELIVRSGKGRKDRIVFVANGGGRAMAAWLSARSEHPGPLFLALTKSGRLTARRISGQAIQDVCQKRAREAGVDPFTPHDLRRSFVSDLLDAGEDIVTVQRAAGHANVQTTARYDRRGDEALRRAATRLHFPY